MRQALLDFSTTHLDYFSSLPSLTGSCYLGPLGISETTSEDEEVLEQAVVGKLVKFSSVAAADAATELVSVVVVE